MLETFLCNELHPHQQDLLWLQDAANAHTARISMQVLRTMFLGTLISCFRDTTWPTRLPDLAVPNHFLWGCVKSKVYETCPAKTDDLKQHILGCIQGIPKEMLQHDCRSVVNDVAVTYRVSYSNSNVSDEFSWTWNAPDSVNKIFPLCLIKLLLFKTRQVFLMHHTVTR